MIHDVSLELSNKYHQILKKQASALATLSEAKRNLAECEARTIGAMLSNDPKLPQWKAQNKVTTDTRLDSARNLVAVAEELLNDLKADRLAIEANIGLIKAYFYSQASIG